MKYTLGMLTRDPRYLQDDKNIEELYGKESEETVKKAHSGLIIILTDFAKSNITLEMITVVLEELMFPQNKIDMFLKMYSLTVGTLRECLSNIGGGKNLNKHLIAFDWRLDYRVRSSTTSENQPVFLIRLTLKDSAGVESEEEMECDLAGMKDMLFKIEKAEGCLMDAAGISSGEKKKGKRGF